MCWIDILLMANYKDKKILFEGKPELIERGSFITSMVKLSQRWCMNRETVKKFLDTLKNDGMISYETSNKRTLIKVIKYEFFQGLCDVYPTAEPATEPTAEPTAEPATYPTTDPAQHKNIKEYKEYKKKDITNVISKEKVKYFVPPTVNEVRDYCLEKGYKVDADVFVDFYESKGWMIGKNKMKDWKAAVRTWVRSDRQSKPRNQKITISDQPDILDGLFPEV